MSLVLEDVFTTKPLAGHRLYLNDTRQEQPPANAYAIETKRNGPRLSAEPASWFEIALRAFTRVASLSC